MAFWFQALQMTHPACPESSSVAVSYAMAVLLVAAYAVPWIRDCLTLVGVAAIFCRFWEFRQW